jgi:hypothetical protein
MQIAITRELPVPNASHLTGLAVNGFDFWRWICLRGAGFPLEGILKLAAAPDLILASDQVIGALDAVERAQEKARSEVEAALDFLRSSGGWEDKKRRKALLDARSRINAREIPRVSDAVRLDSIPTFEEAIQKLARLRHNFEAAFLRASEQTTESVRDIAALPAFREALTWQNRGVMQHGVDLLLQKRANGGSRNSHQRQREEVVASYWQRYCTKNDTVGFFGPVGWARFTSQAECLSVRSGEQLVTARKTYCEAWAIEALGTAILKKHNVQPWIAPILMPFIRIVGAVLHHPLFGRVQLSTSQALLLKGCNGRDTARQIAAALLRSRNTEFKTEGDVYQSLKELAGKKFVFWSFNIPMGPHPEQALRAALQRVEDPGIQRSAISWLDEFESAKRGIAAAAGDADKLNSAFDNLETVFTRATGLAATRNHGQVYAGRTLVYEDCRRDVEVLVGPQLLHSFARPLSLLLFSGRWFASRIKAAYKEAFGRIYSRHVEGAGRIAVDAAPLWLEAIPLLLEDGPRFVAPIQEEFRQKWSRILQLGPGREPVNYSYEQLCEPVAREFSSEGPGWASACYHSPDVMIAADGEEAIRRGECLFVLGEVHMSKNTLDASLFVNQHPSPDELLSAIERDLGALNLVAAGATTHDAGCRTTPTLVGKSAFRLEYLPNAFIGDRSRSIPISSMVVESQEGELMAKSRDGRFRVSVMDLVGSLLSNMVSDCFKIFTPRPHTPRIAIDRLVIKRESWRFPLAELQFASCSDPAEGFLGARIWAHRHRIPRFVFYKSPVETKPSYLDLQSPILASVFFKQIRRTLEAHGPDAMIDVSEMLPSPEQTWLRDKHGRRYASELRMVAVDLSSASPRDSRAAAPRI